MPRRPKSIARLLTAAQNGNTTAQFELATRLREGDRVLANAEAALHWYREAAFAGHPEAMNDLGSMLLNGIGATTDTAQAAAWYAKAAAAGNVTAMFNLALRYLHGDGTDLRPDYAASLLANAAQAGHVEAIGELGTLFMLGNGVGQDYETAAKLHGFAAAEGDVTSIGNLASYLGKVEERALRGSETAALLLAWICCEGIALEKDSAQALAWYHWAKVACRPQGGEADEVGKWAAFLKLTADPAIHRDAEPRFQAIKARAETLTEKEVV